MTTTTECPCCEGQGKLNQYELCGNELLFTCSVPCTHCMETGRVEIEIEEIQVQKPVRSMNEQ